MRFAQFHLAVALFFRTVPKRDYDIFTEARPMKRRKLPVILRVEEGW